MNYKKTVSLLVFCIVVLSLVAATAGIFTKQGPGPHEFQSIHGQKVMIYGQGIYKNMSADVAPQGIAQDVVTLVIGIPMLLIGLYYSRKGSLGGRYLLAGTLGYFLVTYLFYLVMAMFNQLYLVYVALLSASFFAFILTIMSFELKNLSSFFNRQTPVRFVGGFLFFNAIAIGLLWLGVVVPPLLNGTVPVQVEHYTTLIVQGLDLAVLLPSACLSGVLLIRRKPFGYLMAPVYIIFLSILMSALTAKIIAMSMAGANVFPVIIIIPIFNITAIICSVLILKNISNKRPRESSITYSA